MSVIPTHDHGAQATFTAGRKLSHPFMTDRHNAKRLSDTTDYASSDFTNQIKGDNVLDLDGFPNFIFKHVDPMKSIQLNTPLNTERQVDLPDVTPAFMYQRFSKRIPSHILSDKKVHILIINSGVERHHPYIENVSFGRLPGDDINKDWTDTRGSGTQIASTICQVFKYAQDKIVLYSKNILMPSGKADFLALQNIFNHLKYNETEIDIIILPTDTIKEDHHEKYDGDLLSDLVDRYVMLCHAQSKMSTGEGYIKGPIKIGSHDKSGRCLDQTSQPDFTTEATGFFVANHRYGVDDPTLFKVGTGPEISLGLTAAVAGVALLFKKQEAAISRDRSENMKQIFRGLLFKKGDHELLSNNPLIMKSMQLADENTRDYNTLILPMKLFDLEAKPVLENQKAHGVNNGKEKCTAAAKDQTCVTSADLNVVRKKKAIELEIPGVPAAFLYEKFARALPGQVDADKRVSILIFSTGVHKGHPYFKYASFESALLEEDTHWCDKQGCGTKIASTICQAFKHLPECFHLDSKNISTSSGRVNLTLLEKHCRYLVKNKATADIVCLPIDTAQADVTADLAETFILLAKKYVVLCPAFCSYAKVDNGAGSPLRIGSHDLSGQRLDSATKAEFTAPEKGYFVANHRYGIDDTNLFQAAKGKEISVGLAAAIAAVAILTEKSTGRTKERTAAMRDVFSQLMFEEGDLKFFAENPLILKKLKKVDPTDLSKSGFLIPVKLFNLTAAKGAGTEETSTPDKLIETKEYLEAKENTLSKKTSGRQAPGNRQAKEHENEPMEVEAEPSFSGRRMGGTRDLSELIPGTFIEGMKDSIDYIIEHTRRVNDKIHIAFLDSGCNTKHIHFRDMGDVENISCVPNSPADQDPRGHGTIVIGLFWSFFTNTSLSDKIKVYNIKIAPDVGAISVASFRQGIQYLSDNESIHIANISAGFFGYPEKSPTLGAEVKRLTEKMTIISAAESEDGRFAFPASETIAIGSCDGTGNTSQFTPKSRFLHFLAQGEGLAGPSSTTDPCSSNNYRISDQRGNSYATAIATGMSTLIMLNSWRPIFHVTDEERLYLRSTRVMKRLLYAASEEDEFASGHGYGALQPAPFLQNDDNFLPVLDEALQRNHHHLGKDI